MSGSPYGVDAAGEEQVYVPVMLSPGRVAHYAATFDEGTSWRPACGADVQLEDVDDAALEGRQITPCPQCQRWAREARRLSN